MPTIISRSRWPGLALVCLAALPPALAQESPLGFAPEAGAALCVSTQADAGPAGSADAPLPIVVVVDPGALRQPDPLGPVIDCAARRGLQLVARLDPPVDWQRAPDPYAAVAGWIADVDRLLVSLHGRVRQFQLGSRPDLVFTPESYVFLIQKVATLIRSVDPQATLAAGAIGGEAGPWLDRIDAAQVTPYIERLALEEPADLSRWLPRLARDYPGRAVWLQWPEGGHPADPGTALRRWHEARAAGVERVWFPYVPGDPATAVMLNLARSLPFRFVIDPGEPAATAPAGAVALRFVDPMGPERAAILPAPPDGPLEVPAGAVRGLRAVDLATGMPIGAHAGPGAPAPAAPSADADAAEGGRTLIVLDGTPAGPALVRYVAMQGLRARAETVGVTDEYEMSAEEILARNRAFEASQARSLDHYESRATLAYHYRAETLGESIEVISVNRFFCKGKVGEYQELELYVNGARWRGRAPSLPFIQAEKVTEVPLDIRLDPSYTYRVEGREEVGGRPAWRLAFDPIDPQRSLYSGQVWIDRESFARLRIRLVQHALNEPITSNTDVIEYGSVPGCSGGCWLPVRADRQMVFTVLGRAVAVERRVTYEQFSVNAPEFDAGRQQAYASGQPILRDDDTGLSYLVKDPGGLRVQKAESLRNVAFFGGIGLSSSGSPGAPFGGLNYFDFNWRNTGTQFDLAFAGPLVDVAWTDPRLRRTPWELTLDGRFVGLAESFHKTTSDGREDRQDVDILEERGLAVLSRPVSPFQKAVLQAELLWSDYRRTAPDDPNGLDFVPPQAGLSGVATVRWNYHRRGYLVDLWSSYGHRFGWSDWGMPVAPAPGAAPVLAGGSARDTEFGRWGLTALKSFFPAEFHDISLGVSLFDGAGLDRFSRFRIGDFRNARVRGFNSQDLTFDRGVTAQLNYKFTLKRAGASVEFGLEGATIRNEEDFGGWAGLAGGGTAVSFSGPGGTLMSLRFSYGLASSLDIDYTGVSTRFIVVKTMDHWPRRRGR